MNNNDPELYPIIDPSLSCDLAQFLKDEGRFAQVDPADRTAEAELEFTERRAALLLRVVREDPTNTEAREAAANAARRAEACRRLVRGA